MNKVQVEYGATINIGNFESIRISVRLEDVVTSTEKETVDELYKRAKKYVLQKARNEAIHD
jgi:hypothetical protein